MSNAQQVSPRSFSVLTCFDYTDASGYAFEQAARIAARIPSSELHLIHVTSGETSDARARQVSGQLHGYIDGKTKSMGDMDGQSVGVHVRHGEPAREIAQLAAEIDSDLIVIGSSNHPHLKSLLLGTIADKLYQHSPCPIIVAGPKPAEPRVHYPAIEPPCPDCVRARAASGGAQWWCARHTARGRYGVPGHVYSYQTELPFASHDSEVIPTGIDF
jgi:nucleotide-binding universal stress UspA family protein